MWWSERRLVLCSTLKVANTRSCKPRSLSAAIAHLILVRPVKLSRMVLAFLWLSIGYWIISFVVPLVLLFLPFAKSSGGVSTSMSDGIYKIQFPSSPGDIVALLVSTDSGDKQVSFPNMPAAVHGSSQHTQWASPIYEFLIALVFAAVSIPILRRLFRDRPNQAMEPTANHPHT
jgi:hypothetical protein